MATQPLVAEADEREHINLERGAFALPQVDELRSQAPILTLRQRIRARAEIIASETARDIAFEYERGTLALLVPLAMGVGALLYFASPVEPLWFPLLLWMTVLGIASRAVRAKPLMRMIVIGVALGFVGAGLAKFEAFRADTKVLGSEITTKLTGDVVRIDNLANGRMRLVLDVVKTERPVLRYQPQRVRVSAHSLPPGLMAGSRIFGPVKLHPPSGPIRPGGYDFSFEGYFDGLGAVGYFLATPRLEAVNLEGHFSTQIENLRSYIAARIRAAISGPEGEIAAALIVGVRAGIPESVNESLRRTGLAHILSISGLHMALVGAIAMGGIRWVLATVPGFASRYPIKKYAAAGALLLISAYLLISGGDIAAQRSFVMLAIMLISVLMDRRALSMRNLAIAATIVLVVSPHEVVGPSFQMSFAATAALVGAYSIWSSSRSIFVRPKIPTQKSIFRKVSSVALMLVLGTVLTALVAGLATSIYGIWHFQRVSPLSIVANLVVSPIVSLIVMPFAVLAAIAMPFGVDSLFLVIMGKGLSAMLVISDWLSERSPVDAVGLVSGFTVICFTAALLSATIPTTRLRWISLIFFLLGACSLKAPIQPDVLITEDARLVGLRDSTGRLLINRPQSTSFTIDGWKKALAADEVIGPTDVYVSPTRKAASNTTGDQVESLLANVSRNGFLCGGDLCLAEHESGSIVAISKDSVIPKEICMIADLIVVQAVQFERLCQNDEVYVIDAKALARRGAAAISFASINGANNKDARIEYAFAEPYRPWHAHRAFSRAARGLPPYIPRARTFKQRTPSAAAKSVSKPGSAQRDDPEP